METLQELITRFKNGDVETFTEIYERCVDHIKFVCSNVLNSIEDVEEIVQDTFMKVFSKARELEPETFMALLRKIATDKCYDVLRKNSRVGQPISVTEEGGADVELSDTTDFLPEIYIQNKEANENLLAVINTLPLHLQEIVYLYYYADVNAEEIAAINDMPASTVRKQLDTARQAIKEQWTRNLN